MKTVPLIESPAGSKPIENYSISLIAFPTRRIDVRIKTTALIVLCFFIGLITESSGQVASALIRENEVIPGSKEIVATGINNSATNGFGGFSFTLTAADTSTSLIWGSFDGSPGQPLAIEGPSGDLLVTSFESFFGMSDVGDVFYGTTSDDTISMITGLDGVFLNDTLVLNEDEAIDSVPGTFSTFNSRPGITANGIPYWVGGITFVEGEGTDARVLFMGPDAEAILMSGDNVVGVPEPIGGSGIDFNVRMSHCGSNFIMASFLEGGDDVVHINGEALTTDGALIRTGVAIPISAGGTGDNFDNFDFMGVGESGRYMVTGDSDGDASTDEFIMLDGQIVLREGDFIGDDMLSGSIEGAFMNDDGDWSAIWDADIDGVNQEVLILNGDIILSEGDQVDWNGDGDVDLLDDGAVIDNFTGISTLTMSRVNASGNLRIYFTADVVVNGETLEGGFVINAPGNPIVIGDVNGDGNVDLFDVFPFVKAIVSQTYIPGADINGDNQVDLLDVEPFIPFLTGG